MTVPNSLPRPRWISPMHVAIVLACMTTVLVAAIFQYRVVMGYAPQVRFLSFRLSLGFSLGSCWSSCGA